jgi:hypothetical protein
MQMCRANLHGFWHVKQTSNLFTAAAGMLDAAKASAANLLAQLHVETADKQQLSTKLADLKTIRNKLETKVPFCSSTFILYWNQGLLDYPCLCVGK